jgi:hypothetical protein
MAEIVQKAWDIVNDAFAERPNRLAAMREIRAAHNDVFEKLLDAGVFERKLDATTNAAPRRSQAGHPLRIPELGPVAGAGNGGDSADRRPRRIRNPRFSL